MLHRYLAILTFATVSRSENTFHGLEQNITIKISKIGKYSVSKKKLYLAKCDYMGPFKPVCDIPYYLLQ